MASARTAFALAALAALATIGHAAALPIDLSAPAADLSAPAAAPQGDGLVPDTGAQRARRWSWDDVWNAGVSTVQTVATVAVCATPGSDLAFAACGIPEMSTTSHVNYEKGELVVEETAPIYGFQCGMEDIANNKYKDELDQACLFHDVCTSTDYDNRDPYFKETFPGAIDWGKGMGNTGTGNCKCESEALRRAMAARNTYWWWTLSASRFESARFGTVLFFSKNVNSICKHGEQGIGY